MGQRRLQVLLVEDSPSDVRLLQEALKGNSTPFELRVASDGVEAMEYLREAELGLTGKPDIIFLDLNLPRKNGREVLLEVKSSPALKHIPVLIMTSSKADDDIQDAYTLNANCYIAKPANLDEYIDVVRSIEAFWFSIATLPEPVHSAAMASLSPNVKRAAY